MTPADYWDGWYAAGAIAAVVGYVVMVARGVTVLAIWRWWTKE